MHNKCFFQNLYKTKCKEKCESPQKSVHPAENMSAKTSLPSQGLNPRSINTTGPNTPTCQPPTASPSQYRLPLSTEQNIAQQLQFDHSHPYHSIGWF